MLDLLLLGQKIAPDFFWDARGGVLPPGATFTRGSSGWYFNSAGVLTQASTNVARFDYDPATLTQLGYLAETQSTNGLLWSQEISSVAHAGIWSGGAITPTINAGTAPDGTTTLTRFVETSASGQHNAFQGVTLSANAVVGISAFFKAAARSKAYLLLDGGSGNNVTAVFDLGATTNTAASEMHVGTSSGTLVNTYQRAAGNGLYRVSMVASVGLVDPNVAFGMATAATGNTFDSHGQVIYTGDGASDVYVWGAQVDTANVGVTSYMPTSGSTVTRATDILTLPVSSLPGWRPNAAGVLVAAYRLQGPRGTAVVASLADSGFANTAILYENYSNTGFTRFNSNAGGTIQLGGGATPSPFVRRKTAIGWGPIQQIAHGGTFDASTPGQVPMSMVNLRIGTDDGTNGLNGTIESFAYYSGARSNAFVQAVSR